MKKELEEKLYNKFPKLYRQKDLNMSETAMCWGFCCGDGWYKIINDLSKKLEPLGVEAVQVKEKFGCYDEETEVLTKKGWKFFKALKYSDEIAVLSDKKELIYRKPIDIIAYHYTGKMYRLETRGVSLNVTPNHNLLVAKGTCYNGKYSPPKKVEYPFELVTPDKYFGKNKHFLKGADWNGISEKIFILPEHKRSNWFWNYRSKCRVKRTMTKAKREFDTLAWLEFIGFYVAEGSCHRNTEVSIACNNVDGGKERKYIESVLNKLGLPIKPTMLDKPACVYKIYDIQLGTYLLKECGHLAPNKRVPAFVKGLSPELIITFLNGLFRGDGCKTRTSETLCTTSKQLSDDVQELLVKSGYSFYHYTTSPSRAGKIKGKYDVHYVNWLKNSYSHNTQNKGLSKNSCECWEDYNGMVYCATVPGNILYIRRNGKGVWCGNSLRFYTDRANDEAMRLILKAEKKSLKTCEVCGKPGSLRGKQWLKTLCDDCCATWKKG